MAGTVGSRGPMMMASVVMVLGACSDGSSELSSREIHRAVGEVCADEVDVRAEDGPEAAMNAWLESAVDGDDEAALAAAAYNADAVGRVADEIDDLEAEDDEDAAALDLAVDGLGQRRATWEGRRDRHESSEAELDRDVVITMVEEGAPSHDDWNAALAHFDVTERDCGIAVP